MPARTLVTGPAEFYFSTVDPGGPYLYLGATVAGPLIVLQTSERPVYADVAGDEPIDTIFRGVRGFIAARLNRYDDAALAVLDTMPTYRPGLVGGPARRGITQTSDHGGLMIADRHAFSVVVNFPYGGAGGTVNNVAGGLPACYRFFACRNAGPDQIKPGTRAYERDVYFVAARIYVQPDGTPLGGWSVAPGAGAGDLTLYDTVRPALPPAT